MLLVVARMERRRGRGTNMIGEDPKIVVGVEKEAEKKAEMKSGGTSPQKEVATVIKAGIGKTKEIGVEVEVENVAGKRGRVEMRGIVTKREAVEDIKIIQWNENMTTRKSVGNPTMKITPLTKRKTDVKSVTVIRIVVTIWILKARDGTEIQMIERVAEETQKIGLESRVVIGITGIEEIPAKSDGEVETMITDTTTMVTLKVGDPAMVGAVHTKIDEICSLLQGDGIMVLKHTALVHTGTLEVRVQVQVQVQVVHTEVLLHLNKCFVIETDEMDLDDKQK